MNNRAKYQMRGITLSMLLLLFIQCEKDAVPTQTITGNQTGGRTLIVEVLHLQNLATNSLIPVKDVEIRLFDSEENFIIETGEVQRLQTGADGKATFKGMSAGYYYVLAVHPTHGRMEDHANIPEGAVRSYLELIYY